MTRLIIGCLLITLLCLPSWSKSQLSYATSLEVVNKSGYDGNLFVALHRVEEAEPDLKWKNSPILETYNRIISKEDTLITLNLNELERGYYCIRLYLDQNNNKKLDKSKVGVPKEPFGFSNNPTIGYKQPLMKDTVFSVPFQGKLTINLKKLKR